MSERRIERQIVPGADDASEEASEGATPDDVSQLVARRFRSTRQPAPDQPTGTPRPRPPSPVPDEPTGKRAPAPLAGPVAPAPLPDAAPPRPAEPAASPEVPIAMVGNERFLPLPNPILVPTTEPGPIVIIAPAGTSVHTIQEGRVTEVDVNIVGEVIVRVDGDRFYRYRRLLPSSIRVAPGDHVAPGSVLGTVAAGAADERPALVVGLQGGDGTWQDIHADLVGLPDPGELGLRANSRDQEWVDPLAADQARADASAPAPEEDHAPPGPTEADVAALVASRARKQP